VSAQVGTLTAFEVASLAPWIVLGAAPVVVLLAIALRRDHTSAAVITLLGFAGAAVALSYVMRAAPLRIGEMLVLDGYAAWFIALILAAAAATVLLAFACFAPRESLRAGPVPTDAPPEELYALVGLATLGAAVLASAAHFTTVFLGIELVSVPLYALVAYRRDRAAVEAGFKYLVLASTASALMLFGMALVYADLGTMSLRELSALSVWRGADSGMVAPGVALIAVGIGFKLALAPLHAWSPDVYQGASAPVAAFVATVSKGGVVAVAARLFVPLILAGSRAVPLALALLAGLSILVGNLLALWQKSVRRLLGYSSIAHLGTMMLAIAAAEPRAVVALGFYAVAYAVTLLAVFAALAVLASPGGREPDTLDELAGLAWRRPVVAAVLGLGMLSLAGMPFTAGFTAKLAVAAAGVAAGRLGLVVVLAIGSAIGIFYYLRVIAALVAEPARATARTHAHATQPVPATVAFVLTAFGALTVWLGVHPWSFERLFVALLAIR
jgi:NADH-quinone oxidoreductase subunit N